MNYPAIIHWLASSADSLGHVQGPVRDVVGDPGVAGETLGEERVVAFIGGAVLHQPARNRDKDFTVCSVQRRSR